MFVAALGLFSTSYTVYGMTMERERGGGEGGELVCACLCIILCMKAAAHVVHFV